MRSSARPATRYIKLLYCHVLRNGLLGSRWRSAASMPALSRWPPVCTRSCRGSPVRCVRRSRRLACSVATGSRSRNSGNTSRTCISQSSQPSSTSKARAVAVNDLVTEQIGNTVSDVTRAPVSMSRTPHERSNGASFRRTAARARPGMRHSAISSATSSSNCASSDRVSGMTHSSVFGSVCPL